VKFCRLMLPLPLIVVCVLHLYCSIV